MRALALVGLLGYASAANAAEVVQVRPWQLETAIDNIVAAIPR